MFKCQESIAVAEEGHREALGQKGHGRTRKVAAWGRNPGDMAKDLERFDLDLEEQGPRCTWFSKTALKTFNFISVIMTREQMACGVVDANATKHRVREEARHCSVGSWSGSQQLTSQETQIWRSACSRHVPLSSHPTVQHQKSGPSEDRLPGGISWGSFNRLRSHKAQLSSQPLD